MDRSRRCKGRNWRQLSNNPVPMTRRLNKQTRKCFKKWCLLTPSDPNYNHAKQSLQATKYGRKLLDEPLAEEAETNASIVHVLNRDVLPYQGKHRKGRLIATLCQKTNGSTIRQKAEALGLSVNQVLNATSHEREVKQPDPMCTAKDRRRRQLRSRTELRRLAAQDAAAHQAAVEQAAAQIVAAEEKAAAAEEEEAAATAQRVAEEEAAAHQAAAPKNI